MSELVRSIDDAAIEAMLGRRVSGHADRAFLSTVVAAATAAPQDRSRTFLPSLRRPRTVWVVLTAAALLVAGLLLVGVGSHPPTPPLPSSSIQALIVHPSPSSLPSPSEAVTCGTLTADVTTGAQMPPTTTKPATVPAGVLKIGAYLTSAATDAEPGAGDDLWVIRSGAAQRIAHVEGPGLGRFAVDDISADGNLVLLQIGEIHGGDPGPSCDDLYAIDADGSAAERLTSSGPGEHALAGRFSSDGRYVGFSYQDDPGPRAGLGWRELAGPAAPTVTECDAINELQVAWAPDTDRLVGVCDAGMVRSEPGVEDGQAIALDIVRSDVVGIGWTSPNQLLVMKADDGPAAPAPIEIHPLTIGAAPGPVVAGSSDPIATEGFAEVAWGSGTVSPDGRSAVVWADATDTPPGGYYTVDLGTGHTRKLLDGDASLEQFGWSTDSSAVVFAAFGPGGSAMRLTTIDLASGRSTIRATLPTEYVTGFWRGA